jgi:hypothetical protein
MRSHRSASPLGQDGDRLRQPLTEDLRGLQELIMQVLTLP